jgi:transcriptional regulator with XRE-family HTH domain
VNNKARRVGRFLDAYSIGLKLRALRQQKGLTLSRLSAETGLSTALLSKLETDRMIPTLPTLSSICRAFGVGLSFFFTEPTKHSVSITRKAHAFENARSKGELKTAPLNPSTCARLLARVVEFPAGTVVTLTEAGSPLSCVVHILTGRLHLVVGGDPVEVLETGDCVCVESDMLISWSKDGTSTCRALVVTPG